MDKIKQVIERIEALSLKNEVVFSLHLIEDAKAELAEVERTMEGQSRRYANLAEEHRDLAKNERDLAHRVHKAQRAATIDDVRTILQDAKL